MRRIDEHTQCHNCNTSNIEIAAFNERHSDRPDFCMPLRVFKFCSRCGLPTCEYCWRKDFGFLVCRMCWPALLEKYRSVAPKG